jgi:MFS family permease
LGRIIVIASFLFGIGLIGFSFSRVFWLSAAMMVVTGFGMMVQMTSTNTVLQTIVDEDKRGRVMSFYTMAFMGMVPFGSLFAGSLASVIGTPETTLVGGISCILGSLLFARKLPAFRETVRPIYMERGILSQRSLPTAPPEPEGT